MAKEIELIGDKREEELQKAREEYQKKFDEDIRKLLEEAENG
jgi:hypothetical protein